MYNGKITMTIAATEAITRFGYQRFDKFANSEGYSGENRRVCIVWVDVLHHTEGGMIYKQIAIMKKSEAKILSVISSIKGL